MSSCKLPAKSGIYNVSLVFDGIKEVSRNNAAIENRPDASEMLPRDRERSREIASRLSWNAYRPSRRGYREKHQGERTGRIVAQMKFRARDFRRTLSLSLFDLFLLFCQLLLFRPVDRTRPRQRRAFPVGEARSTLRRRIFKREGN